MYKAKIVIPLSFSQFAQSKNYLDDTVPYYKYESNGLTTVHVFGQTMPEILTHPIFIGFSNILEVFITYEGDHDDYDINNDPADPIPDMHDCDGIFLDTEDPEYDESHADYITEYDDPNHPDYIG